MSSSSAEATVTLVHAVSGESEVVPVDLNVTTLAQVLELAQALLGSGTSLVHHGRRLDNVSDNTTTTLAQAGIQAGDLLMLAPGGGGGSASAGNSTGGRASAAPAPAAPAPSGGGLDFSNLLAAAPPPAAAANSGTSGAAMTPTPIYYPHMSLDDAMHYNPHPAAIVPLLLEKQHLWKELHHHNPKLATSIKQPNTLEASIAAWRTEMALGAVSSAVKQTEHFHEEQRMRQRLEVNADDVEAKAYFEKQKHKQAVQQQFQQMLQEYPESMSKVLMLYIPAKINGHAITAFCDSGAQSTIMSKKLATSVGVLHLVDDRFAGTAVGVGTGKILGRIHLVQLELTDESSGSKYYFPCTITVMDDPPPGASEMPFLLGLDMMKRHLCKIDLEQQCLQFKLAHAASGYMKVPFLHEKDLEQHQGGTKGFDAAKANAELEQAEKKAEEDEKKQQASSVKKKDGNDKDDAMSDE